MTLAPLTKVIIPAFNEEGSVGLVVQAIPKKWVSEIIVVNNGSTDKTEVIAKQAGATVINEPRAGYGYACLAGIQYLKNTLTQDVIVVFMDGDYSDYPEELIKIIEPITNNNADLVIGSRALGERERNSMTIPQLFGNWLATRLLRLFYGVSFTDLGPFRAISFNNLVKLNMQDVTYGWTVEMQLKAAKNGLRCTEVPVKYRKRIGVSKVSGTIKGTFMAGYKIIVTIFKYL